MREKELKDYTNHEVAEQLMAAARKIHPVPREGAPAPSSGECCRVVRLLREIGLKHLWVYYADRKFEAAKLNYCPECGKRL